MITLTFTDNLLANSLLLSLLSDVYLPPIYMRSRVTHQPLCYYLDVTFRLTG